MRQVQKRKRKGYIDIRNVDVRAVLDSINVSYSERGKNVSEGWIGLNCPFCDDSSNHLGINLSSPVMTCYRCAKTGNILTYLTEILGSLDKALEAIKPFVSGELSMPYKEERKTYATKVILPESSTKMTLAARDYLKSRGYDPDHLHDEYNFQYTGPLGIWKNRIIVPIMHRMRLISFTSIDVAEETINRYKHCPDEESVIPIKHHLFGLDQTDGRSCIVVEGHFDKFRIGQGAVATFGTKVTSDQIRLLSKFENVTILFDGDDAGRRGATQLSSKLSAFCKVTIIGLDEGKDPDKLTASEIQKIRSIAGVKEIW